MNNLDIAEFGELLYNRHIFMYCMQHGYTVEDLKQGKVPHDDFETFMRKLVSESNKKEQIQKKRYMIFCLIVLILIGFVTYALIS